MEDWILLLQTDTLVKKAKELSSICDVDVGLILFSPNGGLIEFASGESVEDLYLRYLSQPSETRGIENEEGIIRNLIRLKKERELTKKVTMIQELWEDAVETNRSHRDMKEKVSLYNPNINDLKSVDDIYECENFITEALNKIYQLKNKKLNDQRNRFVEIGEPSTFKDSLQEGISSANNNKRRNITNQVMEPNKLQGPGSSTSNAKKS